MNNLKLILVVSILAFCTPLVNFAQTLINANQIRKDLTLRTVNSNQLGVDSVSLIATKHNLLKLYTSSIGVNVIPMGTDLLRLWKTDTVRLVLDGSPGIQKNLVFKSDSLYRWTVGVEGSELGSNQGTNLVVKRFADNGTYIDDVLSIVRSNKTTTFTGSLYANNLSGINTGDETTSSIKSKLGSASSVSDGYLLQADWNTFNAKQDALGFIPENSANKSTSTELGTSDVLYPTQNAVKAYVDSRRIVKSSTVATVTSSTSLTTLNNLSTTLPASTRWHFEASGSISSSSTNGARLGLLVPTGATVYYEIIANNSSATNIISNASSFSSSAEIPITFGAVASTVMQWKISGLIVTTGSAGTFGIQGRTANAANTVTFNIGSRMRLEKE
jgi:hypothetical protein